MSKNPDETRILAGDVGGTKTILAILHNRVDRNGDELVIERMEKYPSGDFASLGAIIRHFFNGEPTGVACAGFGVPGPVKNGRVRTTNLTWSVDAHELAANFGFSTVELINDLAANAYGIAELKDKDFFVLQKGALGAEGNRCVVSPGTGLGQAGLFWDGKKHRVWACEGGHSTFAPHGEVQVALMAYLHKQFGHVSVERVVSGLGIQNIYAFLRDTGRGTELPEVRVAMKTEDHGKVISAFADSGRCPMCMETLEIFIACLGSEAGNMALKAMATGGVYLGGGIPVKMQKDLQGVGFLHPFNSKGRMQSLLEGIPIKIILNEQTALLGAARHAADALP